MCIAIATTIGMAIEKSCNADTNVAIPSGKLCIPIASAVKIPVLSNLLFSSEESLISDVSCTS